MQTRQQKPRARGGSEAGRGLFTSHCYFLEPWQTEGWVKGSRNHSLLMSIWNSDHTSMYNVCRSRSGRLCMFLSLCVFSAPSCVISAVLCLCRGSVESQASHCHLISVENGSDDQTSPLPEELRKKVHLAQWQFIRGAEEWCLSHSFDLLLHVCDEDGSTFW